jgi:hypothetical protein
MRARQLLRQRDAADATLQHAAFAGALRIV